MTKVLNKNTHLRGQHTAVCIGNTGSGDDIDRQKHSFHWKNINHNHDTAIYTPYKICLRRKFNLFNFDKYCVKDNWLFLSPWCGPLFLLKRGYRTSIWRKFHIWKHSKPNNMCQYDWTYFLQNFLEWATLSSFAFSNQVRREVCVILRLTLNRDII